MKVTDGKVVSIHYTLTNDEGQVLDSSREEEPLAYLHGQGNIIAGLEDALEGRQTGASFNVTLDPEDAYGQRDDALVETFPRDAFSGVDDVEPGMRFRAEFKGKQRIVTVTDVEGHEVTVDANHPLAGERLTFDVEVTDVRDASQEELTHGHVHTDGQSH